MKISVSTLYDHRKCKCHITDRTTNTFPETTHEILTHFVSEQIYMLLSIRLINVRCLFVFQKINHLIKTTDISDGIRQMFFDNLLIRNNLMSLRWILVSKKFFLKKICLTS